MNGLALAWRLARRELRAGLGGFRVFLACLILGVGAIAGVGSLSASVSAGLLADGRALLGGDVDLRLLHRPATADQEAWLAARAQARSDTVEMRAMASPQAKDRWAMVELKAVDAAYPLVGAMETVPPRPLDRVLARQDGTWGAVAEKGLLRKLSLETGDRIKVGDAVFTVRAVLVREPDRVASVFSFGPRLLVPMAALAETGLVQPGSQIRYHHRVLLPPGINGAAWVDQLEARFPDAGWRIRRPDDAAPGVQRFIDRMTLFLTFIGLVVLLVGGLGVGNAVDSYLDGKTATIATMKCLGAAGGLVFRIYLLQILALAGLGIGGGLVLGAALPVAAAWGMKGHLAVAPVVGIYPEPLALAALFGLLGAVTVALGPLARAGRVPVAVLYRDRVAPVRMRLGWRSGMAAGLGVAALAGLTILSANDRYFAYWFVGGTIVTLALLRSGAAVLAKLSRRVRARTPAWRLALGNLHRPGAATAGTVVSLGSGLSVLVAVALIEGNLGRHIAERLPEEAPAFFFIDIQDHQAEAFDAAVTAVEGTGGLKRVPSLRGRIVKIAGRPVEEVEVDPSVAWAIRGDRALTYAVHPPEGAEIAAGHWWPEDYSGPPIISFDAGVARGLGVGLGDTLTLNVLGRDITATITSLREIDWRSLRFDFAIIFAPGTLEAAPHTHIAAVRVSEDREAAIEQAVAGTFPNITAIRVREALEAAGRILAGIGGAVRGTAALTILAGALVLGGTIAATRQRRVYEAVVFKVLGATRNQVLAALLIEYTALGLATGVIGTAVGTLTAWAVVVFLMGTPWAFLPGVAVGTALACLAITVLAGFAGTWKALGGKAAPYLRNE